MSAFENYNILIVSCLKFLKIARSTFVYWHQNTAGFVWQQLNRRSSSKIPHRKLIVTLILQILISLG